MESEKAIENRQFNRLFSLTLYKNKKISLGEMSFYKDFIHDSRGDLYPVLERNGGFHESITDGFYRFDGGQGRFLHAAYRCIFSICHLRNKPCGLRGRSRFLLLQVRRKGRFGHFPERKRFRHGPCEEYRFRYSFCRRYAFYRELPRQAYGRILPKSKRHTALLADGHGKRF